MRRWRRAGPAAPATTPRWPSVPRTRRAAPGATWVSRDRAESREPGAERSRPTQVRGGRHEGRHPVRQHQVHRVRGLCRGLQGEEQPAGGHRSQADRLHLDGGRATEHGLCPTHVHALRVADLRLCLSGGGVSQGAQRPRPLRCQPLHRLPVLHHGVPLRRAEVPVGSGSSHRPEVHHVSGPDRGREVARLRQRVSDRGHDLRRPRRVDSGGPFAHLGLPHELPPPDLRRGGGRRHLGPDALQRPLRQPGAADRSAAGAAANADVASPLQDPRLRRGWRSVALWHLVDHQSADQGAGGLGRGSCGQIGRPTAIAIPPRRDCRNWLSLSERADRNSPSTGSGPRAGPRGDREKDDAMNMGMRMTNGRRWPEMSFWRLVFLILAAAGSVATVLRFTRGLGATTNLSDQFPWGLWIGFDILCGVGLASAGFTITAVVYIYNLKRFTPIIRPTVLTAFLGYLFVILALLFDLGQPHRIWHALVMWNPRSVMFEVAWCVMLYTTVLALEFSPIVFERLNLERPQRIVRAISVPLVIVGVILSMLHQSSLGSLYLIVPEKLHPLWYSPLLPVFFFTSAIAAGLAMVIVESYLCQRAYNHHLEMGLLEPVGRAMVVVLSIYGILRLQDLARRGALAGLRRPDYEGTMFLLEMGLGVLLPILLLAIPRIRRTRAGLVTGAFLAVLGFVMNRIDRKSTR